MELLKAEIPAGVRCYDFLTGTWPYKRRLANAVRVLEIILVKNPRPRTRLRVDVLLGAYDRRKRPDRGKKTGPAQNPQSAGRDWLPVAGRKSAFGKISFVGAQGDVQLKVEIAKNPVELRRGIRGRRFLSPDEGALLFFGRSQRRRFDTKGALAPLDRVLLDSNWRVVNVFHDILPGGAKMGSVLQSSQYVLEVMGGLCRKHGIEKGLQMNFSADPA
jgi:uncharacterized membrane protein (UPF0127 family)